MTSSRKTKKSAREKIVEAALQLFSKNGFHATTTRSISQKAGVNEVTLFRHFKNKAILFQEVLQTIKNIGFDADRTMDFDFTPEDAIRFAVEETIALIEKHPRELRLLNLAMLDGVKGFEEEFIAKNVAQASAFISDALKKLQKENRISSKDDPDLLANLLLSLTSDVASQRVLRKSSYFRTYDRASVARAIVDLFLKK